jgi:hypothetical protein
MHKLQNKIVYVSMKIKMNYLIIYKLAMMILLVLTLMIKNKIKISKEFQIFLIKNKLL